MVFSPFKTCINQKNSRAYYSRASVFVLLCWMCCMPLFLLSQSVVINEMMSANSGFLMDEDGDAPDWIELYNPGSHAIHLDGYYISDKIDNLTRWAFPDTTLAAGGFMVLFASGKDRAVPGEELHTNFSVKSAGEDLFLTHQGMIVHYMPAVPLNVNTSYGMQPDGEHPFVVFSQPTPGASNNNAPEAASIAFDIAGGIYSDPFEVTITSSAPDVLVFYTTNGNTPDPQTAMLYQGPLMLGRDLYSSDTISQIQVTTDELYNPPDPDQVPRAITLRAAAFDSLNNRLSPVETNTYFIESLDNRHYGLPLLSICADHEDLFDFERGIFVPGVHWNHHWPDWSGNYYERGREWERAVSLEFYEPGAGGFKQDAGLRIHGGHTRRLPQKPLRLYARNAYGNNAFNYPLFGKDGLKEYQRFAMKPFFASWSPAGFEDHLSNSLVVNNLEADAIRSRPVILYINGEYWGIYFIHERIDTRLLEARSGVDADSIDIVSNWYGITQAGSASNFHALYNYVKNNDLSQPHVYDTVSQWIDIDNFIDYLIFQIYSANYDWPANNMKCWRPQRDGAKWRWIFFDGDAGFQNKTFDAYTHATDTGMNHWPTNERSTLFFRKLLENDLFFQKFFLRLEHLLKHPFSPQSANTVLDETIDLIYHEIETQMHRFGQPESYQQWIEQVITIRSFLNNRNCVLREHTKEMFSLVLKIPECIEWENQPPDVMVYPNPHAGTFNVWFKSSRHERAIMTIHNVTGQLLYTREVFLHQGQNSFRVEGDHLPEGVLLFTLTTNSSVRTKKMLCSRQPYPF